MKKTIALFLIIGIFSCGEEEKFTVDCLPPNLQTGVIAFYPFNGGALADASPNNNGLTNPTTAIPAADRNGNADCASQFDNLSGNDEFLTTANSNFLNGLNAFSVSIWYQPMDTTRSAGSFEVLFARGDQGRCPDRRGEWSVALYDCRRAVFGHNNSVWANTVSSGCQGEIVALTENWHHVVAVKDGDEYRIYFNGNLDEVKSGNANCTNLHIAQDMGDVFVGTDFTGRIDDIIVYNRALSAQEVTELYGLGGCCE